MSAPFVLNVGGVWIPLHRVQRETPRTRTRDRSEFVASGGVRYVQFAARAARTWKLDFTLTDPATVKWLAEAAGGQAGPVWLLDRAAAQANMLDPGTTTGEQGLIATELGIPSATFGKGVAFRRLVRAGQIYHLSGWTTAPSNQEVGRFSFDGGPTTSARASDGIGARPWSTSVLAPADATMTFNVVNDGSITRLRLTEGSVDDAGFYPGQNTPCQVAVSDPDDVLSLYWENRPSMASYSVELTEVG